MNNETPVFACFVDMSKAFDKVNFSILLNKLEKLGLPGYYVKIIEFLYKNQEVRVKYKNSYSDSWMLKNGVRQGAILSPFFFNLYMNDALNKVCSLDVGCKLDVHKSNIIGYADDITVLAPSVAGLQLLVDTLFNEIDGLCLSINTKKSVYMKFLPNKYKHLQNENIKCGNRKLDCVDNVKYLGNIINNKLNEKDDIRKVKNKFYKEFNILLRKFNYIDTAMFLILFRSYCLCFYGTEVWINTKNCQGLLKELSVGYHKAIKKILGTSYHESNHYVCEAAKLLTFENYSNKIRIMFHYRLLKRPCKAILKNYNFFKNISCFATDINTILSTKYQIDDLVVNDKQAVLARIQYVQNHEPQNVRIVPV